MKNLRIQILCVALMDYALAVSALAQAAGHAFLLILV
jgi:hypothetical protein